MGNIELQEENGQEKRESKVVFFLKSSKFFFLVSFILALAISCILILVVASRYIVVTVFSGIIIIGSMTLTLSVMIYIPIKYFSKKNF